MSVGDRDYKQIVRDAIDSIGEDIELKIDTKMLTQSTSMKWQNVYVAHIMIERIPWKQNKPSSTRYSEDYFEK